MIDDPRFVAPKDPVKPDKRLVVRDSILPECLYSLLVAVTIMSCLMIIKTYVVTINISMYSQYVVLILALGHALIRRSGIKNKYINLAVQLASSAVFYIAVINIKIFGFGADRRTKFYLAAFVIACTIFSLVYYCRPTHSAAETEVIFFPAAVHVVGWLFYQFTLLDVYNNDTHRRWLVTHELSTDRLMFARFLVINAVIIAMLFLVMRQLAVFDKKYDHSIRKKSQSTLMLKKQNYITVVFLLLIVLLTFGVILIFPYSSVFLLFWKINDGFWKVFGWVMALLSKIDTGDIDSDIVEETVNYGMDAEENPMAMAILTVASVVGVLIILLVIVFALIRGLKKALKYAEANNSDGDDSIIDIIENIGPLKKMFSGRNRDFGTGYERRIRKQFYDKTRNAMKKGLPVGDSSTPGQIEAVLNAYGDEEISALREEYENVRYGQH
jgi:hypothetical protein